MLEDDTEYWGKNKVSVARSFQVRASNFKFDNPGSPLEVNTSNI